jgi:hypothetical protein
MDAMKPLEKTPVMSDTPSDKMANGKQDERIVIRLEPRLMEMARALVAERDSGTISEYIRGLIIADAAKQGKTLSGINIPGWLIDNLVVVQTLNPRSSASSSTEGRNNESPPGEKPHEPIRDRARARGKT